MTTKRNFIIIKVIVYVLLINNYQLIIDNCYAQNKGVAINSTGSAANNSAMLDVSSTDQGIRIPRVALISTTSALPITNPANSLLVYDSVTIGDVTPGFYYWDGSASKWIKFSTGSGGGWSTSGNTGTDSASDFIGTKDAQAWVMKTNNSERMRIASTGNIGIGTASPDLSASLDISSSDKGILIPRMTTIQRDAIALPSIGLQIFNTDCNNVNYYNGTCWLSNSNSLRSPGLITGATVFCAGATGTFSISAVPGANNYTWTVPAGTGITSGQGTTSIDVTFGSYSGNLCVTANNNCENSQASCIEVVVNTPPSTPGNITGTSAVAKGTAPVSYTVAAVLGATTYNWTVPTGASIASGSGTSTIVVNYPCSASSGNVTVTAQSSCGISAPSVLLITAGPIANAGSPVFGGAGIGGVSIFPTASGSSPPYTYLWSPATGLSSTAIANPVAQCTGATTTYTVTVTDANTCTATSSVVVSRTLTANAGANITGTACGAAPAIGGSPTASGYTPPVTYSWSPTTGLSDPSLSNPFAGPVNTTTYTVIITDANGCFKNSSMVYTAVAPPSLSNTATINYSGSITSWTVPLGITCISIDAYGATGGTGSGGNGGTKVGGSGAEMKGYFSVTAGQVLKVLVGQRGFDGNSRSGGGGGGTFVADNIDNPLIVAGGGSGGSSTDTWYGVGQNGSIGPNGGSSNCCAGGTAGGGGNATSNQSAGGGGFIGDGVGTNCNYTAGGQSFINGGAGGAASASDGGAGGFGGGSGGGCGGSGAGGGYSGGAGGKYVWGDGSNGVAGGGGSYNKGVNQTNTGSAPTGNGLVTIKY
ncbi:MAG: hypothetical protein HGB12_02260 [Bacteroidetes bacterium]|nr:hypothetical protein [Bacteroidota bacterium]